MNQTTKSINRESTKLFLLNYFPILIFFALSLIMKGKNGNNYMH